MQIPLVDDIGGVNEKRASHRVIHTLTGVLKMPGIQSIVIASSQSIWQIHTRQQVLAVEQVGISPGRTSCCFLSMSLQPVVSKILLRSRPAKVDKYSSDNHLLLPGVFCVCLRLIPDQPWISSKRQWIDLRTNSTTLLADSAPV